MKLNQWVVGVGIFVSATVLSSYFLFISLRDSYLILFKGVHLNGVVTSVGAKHDGCVSKCVYNSCIKLSNGNHAILGAKLKAGEEYKFFLLKGSDRILSVDSWSPFTNKRLGSLVWLIATVFSLAMAAREFKKFSRVSA